MNEAAPLKQYDTEIKSTKEKQHPL